MTGLRVIADLLNNGHDAVVRAGATALRNLATDPHNKASLGESTKGEGGGGGGGEGEGRGEGEGGGGELFFLVVRLIGSKSRVC